MFKRKRNRPVFRKRSGISKITQSAAWPYLKIAAILALVGVILFVFFAVAWPLLKRSFGGEIAGVPLPTATNAEKKKDNFLRGEVLLGYRHRNIGTPIILGDTVYFSTGTDNYGTPNRRQVYYTNIADITVGNSPIAGLLGENNNIRSMDVNPNYIVYFDGKNAQPGGGSIRLFDRSKQLEIPEGTVYEDKDPIQAPNSTVTLKEIPYGFQTGLRFAGEDHIVFIERTGEKEDKLYLMNIHTKELTTLCVYKDSPLGFSKPGACGSKVCFSAPDPDHPSDSKYAVIKLLSLTDGSIETYTPQMYAFNPVTNGTSFAWLDGNGGVDTSLFLSVKGASPKRIAQGVADMGIGENFIAWSSKGVVYAYFWEEDITYTVSTEGEYCNLETVSAHAVGWFDITDEKRERDLFKYAVLD